MNVCRRPLDPLDAEALASAAEPVFAADAASHAAACASCGASVERAIALVGALERLSRAETTLPDLAGRVTRLRAFSRRERRTYALWAAPTLLWAALFVGGLGFLAAPALSAGEQAGLGAAALASVLGFLRAAGTWAFDLARVAPPALDAFADALSQERTWGLVSLLLLAPSAFGLSRVFARVRSRRR